MKKLVLALGAVYFLMPQKPPAGYLEATNYNPDALCKADMPSCGTCPGGNVIDNKCYLPNDSPILSVD